MDIKDILQSLERLREELTSLPQDHDSTKQLKEFDNSLQSFIDKTDQEQPLKTSEESESLTDTAKRLETHFATEHPVIESSLREIVDILGRMGI